MKTEILPVEEAGLIKAKKILTEGGLVGMPTETVYGLAADARNDRAVADIFTVKGRPQDNPLIVHVHEEYDLSSLVEITQDYVPDLIKAFMPGPLTLVMKSRNAVSPRVSCGLDSLAVRMPQSPECRKFLRFVDMPIAAPSANISKHTSPVTAMHVFEDFNGKIPLILDGGRCTGGIESTVLNVMDKTPVILRSGLITREDILGVVGRCEYSDGKGPVRSPGTKYRHYHPACETALFGRGELSAALALCKEARAEGKRVFFLADGEAGKLLASAGETDVLPLGNTAEEIARNVYFQLHEAEKVCDLLIAFSMEEKGVLVGVMNRLSKACAK